MSEIHENIQQFENGLMHPYTASEAKMAGKRGGNDPYEYGRLFAHIRTGVIPFNRFFMFYAIHNMVADYLELMTGLQTEVDGQNDVLLVMTPSYMSEFNIIEFMTLHPKEIAEMIKESLTTR